MSVNPSVKTQGSFRLARAVVGSYFRLFYRLKVEGMEHIPRSGGFVIASNHISNLDPPLIGALVPRRIRFMAKQELFRVPLFRRLIHLFGAFPIHRGKVDKEAIRTAVQVVQEGQCLLMFPEGHRSKNGKLGEFLPGVAAIARKAEGAVVPVAIVGPYRLFKPLRVKFGQPISTASLKTSELLALLKSEVSSLIDEMVED